MTNGDEPLFTGAIRAWPRETLAAGPRPAAELRQEATARGIGENALYAARMAEGITMSKDCRIHGRWLWALETTPGKREVDALPTP